MNLIFIGPPASGKGTQADLLAERLSINHVDAGKILREIAKKDPKIRDIIFSGKLVKDEETLKYISKEIEKDSKSKRGVIFDGFPRTLNQYMILKDWLEKRRMKIDKAFFFEVSNRTIIKRLSNRRTCSKCGRVYNLITNPPPKKDFCECGGKLVRRKDDTPSVIRERIGVFNSQTKPLVDFLEKQKILVRLNAERPIKVILEDVLKNLKTE